MPACGADASLSANVTTPLMLILGDEDYRTPPGNGGEQMFRALQYRRVSSVMVRFPHENHELSRRRTVPSRRTAPAHPRNGRLRIEVEDDGPGFDPERVPGNHGLALLRQRLAFTYGDRAILNIHSVPGRTVVSVEIPKSA